MDAIGSSRAGLTTAGTVSEPGGLLDALAVAAVMIDAQGRICLWSPQAEELFGFTAEEALGQYAAPLLVAPENQDLVLGLFAEVMESGRSWAGVFPVRHKDGSTRLVEFRNMRLHDELGDVYALGIASDQALLRRVERDLALSVQLVAQSPIGLAVLDTNLRYVMVNPALERINALPAEQHIGRGVGEALPFLDTEAITATMRQVMATGTPVLNEFTIGRPGGASDVEHAWSVSYYRLDDPAGRVLGLAISVVDVSEQHRASQEAARARRRLAFIADASKIVGTTLDVEQTAHELASVVVPELADLAAVDILDAVLQGLRQTTPAAGGPALFRALAVTAAYSTNALHAADTPGQIASYAADRYITQCVTSGRPVLVEHVSEADLERIAPDPKSARVLSRAGLHSYLAVPLIARGEVLGALDLGRARNELPFDEDDVVLAGELAARAAVCIDNARSYQSERRTALTLQRHLLPPRPPRRPGLEIAYRYQPAQSASEIGGDWFDTIPVAGNKTALVIGDVMGSGINAAATMGQLRTATRTLADLDLAPAEVLRHLDHTAAELDPAFATCIYTVYDPHRGECRIAVAGHLPPILVRPGRRPELLDLPTGTPLGVGDVAFQETTVKMESGDQLVLYTDGLIETRSDAIDARINTLLDLLSEPQGSLDEVCDHLLVALRDEGDRDDVALLIARARPLGSTS
ncbi:SpoIIE family protein phosphatase [Streptomyces sp. NBC_01445]|uniref:SpoIIE family protein phosphatase n=1 Tax=Streptomyces sp. NBC_01445 TaxID=2903869 RepID=UPI002DDBCB98|nr:SpoIIE family protein phosphatase [Streptomyces sp. NBC_01445]WSE09497.1 SpoIIE family protein phosphatase [Streptomyces sp. NBC_01445]